MHQDGTYIRDIEMKIAQGKQATKALHGLIWRQHSHQRKQKKIFRSIILNIKYTFL